MLGDEEGQSAGLEAQSAFEQREDEVQFLIFDLVQLIFEDFQVALGDREFNIFEI